MVAVAVATAVIVSAVRDGAGIASAPLPDTKAGPTHVHALGVNPSDDVLFMGTHSGLWRISGSEQKPKRVTEQSRDTVSFTVVARDRFLASGHPDVGEAGSGRVPPLLGLMSSSDAGRSWRAVSLLGQADFHVLRSIHGRVYGVDATNVRLLISRNGGRTWRERRVPEQVLDLVVNPRNWAHVVAATARGLHESRDAGRSWRRVDDGVGLLAWPAPKRLLLLRSGGELFASRDSGKRWRQIGELGAQPAALLAHNATELVVALRDSTIKRSTDGGVSWTSRSTAG
jgi:hypothetical protein